MILLVINFCLNFGYYGLFLWFPDLFNKLEQYHTQYPNSTARVCEIVQLDFSPNSTAVPADQTSCTAAIPDRQVSTDIKYMHSLLVVLHQYYLYHFINTAAHYRQAAMALEVHLTLQKYL